MRDQSSEEYYRCAARIADTNIMQRCRFGVWASLFSPPARQSLR
jgi:hypothetical protein